MELFAYFDERERRLGIVDTKLAQAAAIFVVLTIVKAVPSIMQVGIWWFAGLALLCAVHPLITFYGSGGPKNR